MVIKGVLPSICDGRADCSSPVPEPAKKVDQETRLYLHVFDTLATHPRIVFRENSVQFWIMDIGGVHKSAYIELISRVLNSEILCVIALREETARKLNSSGRLLNGRHEVQDGLLGRRAEVFPIPDGIKEEHGTILVC